MDTTETKIIPDTPEYDAQMEKEFDAREAAKNGEVINETNTDTNLEGDKLGTNDSSGDSSTSVADDLSNKDGGKYGGFETPEELAAAYAELKGTKEETKTDETKEFSIEKYEDEFINTGKISDKSYEEMAAKGLDKKFVDKTMERHSDVAKAYDNEIAEHLGGRESYNEFTKHFRETEWKGHEDEALSNSLIRAVHEGDSFATKMFMDQLNSKYQASVGVEGQKVTGQNVQVGGDVFQDSNDYRNAIKDPKYAKDSTYRNAVDAKMARSPNVQ